MIPTSQFWAVWLVLQTATTKIQTTLATGDTAPLEHLIRTIAILTTQVSLLALATAGLSYMVGSVLRGAPIPIREIREAGYGLQNDAIRAIFWVTIYSGLSSLVAWTAALLASS